MRVLITGGAGLIGYHTASLCLEKGHEVMVVDNLERSNLLGHKVNETRAWHNFRALEKKGAECILGDISKPETLLGANPDWIIHLAAQCGVPTSIENPRRDFEINTVGALNTLELARSCGAKVAFASTNKVYNIHSGWFFDPGIQRWVWDNPSWDEHGFPLDGDHLRRPTGEPLLQGSRTPYGNSKYMGDLLCQEWHHMYGVPTGVFRMSCIYGENQFSFEEQGWLVWFAIANLKEETITIFGDGKQVRDCLYAGDVAKAYLAYLESDVEHGVWNLGGGPSRRMTLSLNECLTIIERLTGKTQKIEFGDWRPSDQKVYTSDIRAVKEQLSWEPTVDTEEGLEKIVTWVRDNLDLF